jgi:hypothetical protein
MLMADTFAIVFSVLGAIFGHVALWLLLRALFPRSAAGAGEATERGILLPLVVGVPLAGGALLLSVLVGTFLGSIGKALAVAIVCAFLAYAHVGLAGITSLVGRRLGESSDLPWRTVSRGGAALAFAWGLPFLGWFGLLPLSLAIGAGAITIGLVRRLFAANPAPAPLHASATLPSALAPASPVR